jgi:uncharacterized protein YjcR
MFNLIKLDDLAKELQTNVNTVKTWKRRGDIPPEVFHKIGGTVYVKENAFKEWVYGQEELRKAA